MKKTHDFNSKDNQNQFLQSLDKGFAYFLYAIKGVFLIIGKLVPVGLIASFLLIIGGVFFFILNLFQETTLLPLISVVNSQTKFPKLPTSLSLLPSLSISENLSQEEKLASSHNALALVPTFTKLCSYATLKDELTQDQKMAIEDILNTPIPLAQDSTIDLPFEKEKVIAKNLGESYLFKDAEFLLKQGDKWYVQGLTKDPLFKSNNNKYQKSFQAFMQTYCGENTTNTLQYNFVYSQFGIVATEGKAIVKKFPEWLYQYPKPYQQEKFLEHFQLNVLQRLSNIQVLKAFVSGKYYLTKTNAEYNEYTTDPTYEYLLISNPFQETSVKAKVKPYDALNEFFLSFHNTLIDPKEQTENGEDKALDITSKLIEEGYTGSTPITVFAYNEKSLDEFMEKLKVTITREKMQLSAKFEGYSETPQTLQACLSNPIMMPYIISLKNKKTNVNFSTNDYYQVCYTMDNIYLKNTITTDKKGNINISGIKEDIAKAKKVRVKLSISPYVMEGSGTPNLARSEIYLSNILHQLQLKGYTYSKFDIKRECLKVQGKDGIECIDSNNKNLDQDKINKEETIDDINETQKNEKETTEQTNKTISPIEIPETKEENKSMPLEQEATDENETKITQETSQEAQKNTQNIFKETIIQKPIEKPVQKLKTNEKELYELLKGNFFFQNSNTEKLTYHFENNNQEWKELLRKVLDEQLHKYALANELLYTDFGAYEDALKQEQEKLQATFQKRLADVKEQMLRESNLTGIDTSTDTPSTTNSTEETIGTNETEDVDKKSEEETVLLFKKSYILPKSEKAQISKLQREEFNAKKALGIKVEKVKYPINNPYIQYEPLIKEEYWKIAQTAINPVLTLFKQVPDTTGTNEFVAMEMAFKSFIVYSNANENSFFTPLKSEGTIDADIQEWIKKTNVDENVFFDSSHGAFPQKTNQEQNYQWLMKFLSQNIYSAIKKEDHKWHKYYTLSYKDFIVSKGYKIIANNIEKSIKDYSSEKANNTKKTKTLKISLRKIWKIWEIEALYNMVGQNAERFVKLIPLNTSEAEKGAKLFFRDMQTYDLNVKNNRFENFQSELVKGQDFLFLTLFRYFQKVNSYTQLFEQYANDYDEMKALEIPGLNNNAIFQQFIETYEEAWTQENLTLEQKSQIAQEKLDMKLLKNDFNEKLDVLLEEIKHTEKLKNLFQKLNTLNIEKQFDEINESVLRDGYVFGEAFKVRNINTLEKFIKHFPRYRTDANEYLALNGENYLSIIAYNYFTYTSEEKHFETIESTLKGMREAKNGVSNKVIEKIEWDWFKSGLDEIDCVEGSECEEVIQAVKKRNNWNEFKTYINKLLVEVKASLKKTIEEKNTPVLITGESEEVVENLETQEQKIKEIKDTIQALESLLDTYLYFANQAQVTDVWDIVDFWSEDVFACDKQGGTPEEVRACKLHKVRWGKFNLSGYGGSPNGLTGQCVRGANMLNKFFNKGLHSCRYSLNGGDQWASYGGLQYGLYRGMHVGRFPVGRNSVNCTQSNIQHGGKTFGGTPDTMPRFCPVVGKRENLNNGDIKNNMIAVAYGAGWGSYGHVVYIGGVDVAQGKVGVAEMNYKQNLAWGGGIDSLTVRQSLQAVEKYKLYFDLDKPFSLEEIKNVMGLNHIGQVNNEVISNYCQNYDIFNS